MNKTKPEALRGAYGLGVGSGREETRSLVTGLVVAMSREKEAESRIQRDCASCVEHSVKASWVWGQWAET